MPHILMIDDEPDQLEPYHIYLKKKGCTVEMAKTAAQAVSLLRQNRCQLILLDVKMPEQSGLDLCAKLRRLTKAPIIFLSSLSQESDQVQGFQAGGTDYISKGCSLELFWARVEARLKQATLETDYREFLPLTLDLIHQKACIEGNNLHLTQTEFELLVLLSSRPCEIWTVEEIYRAVWAGANLGNATLVQMHLSRMRNKMEEAFPQHEFIETVWGKGYRFIP